MIHVIAMIEIQPGKRDAFVEAFHQLVPLVLEEDGCIEYGPTLDVNTGIEVQQPIRENVVTIMEKWESVDALKAHLVAPHMASYREKVKDLVVNLNLYVQEPV